MHNFYTGVINTNRPVFKCPHFSGLKSNSINPQTHWAKKVVRDNHKLQKSYKNGSWGEMLQLSVDFSL